MSESASLLREWPRDFDDPGGTTKGVDMKKAIYSFILLGLIAMVACQATAQSNPAGGAVINPQIGISLSKLSTDVQMAQTKYRLGYMFGGNIRFGGNVYLQPGIFWHRLGVKLQTTEEIRNQHEFHNDVSSIQVPVLLGINLINTQTLVFRANGGGFADFVTSVQNTPLYTKDDLRKTIFGIRAGVGVDLFNLTGDIGYDYQLSKFFADNIGSDAKLSGWFFTVGIKL